MPSRTLRREFAAGYQRLRVVWPILSAAAVIVGLGVGRPARGLVVTGVDLLCLRNRPDHWLW
jgi:hypothetical protein